MDDMKVYEKWYFIGNCDEDHTSVLKPEAILYLTETFNL